MLGEGGKQGKEETGGEGGALETRGNLPAVLCRISFLALLRVDASDACVLEGHPAMGVLKSTVPLN